MKFKSLGIHGLLLVLFAFMAIMTSNPWYDLSSSTFLLPNNLENLLARTGMYGLLGIGVAFVIITSGIDLSIGSVVCLAGCLLALFLKVDYREAGLARVFENDQANSSLIVYGSGEMLEVGSRIGFSGLRDYETQSATIQRLERVQLDDDGKIVPGTVVELDRPLKDEGSSGRIIRLIELQLSPTKVESNGHRATTNAKIQLADKDQLLILRPGQSPQRTTIKFVTPASESLLLGFTDSFGMEDGKVHAIPVLRHQRMSIPLALISVLAIAGLLGMIHGLFITRVHLQPFVVTLCGLLIYRGMSRWLTNDLPVGFGTEFDNNLRPLGHGKLPLFQWTMENGQTSSFGLPYPFIVLVAVAVVAAILLNKTIVGRYMLALGRNEEAARYSGINTRRITVLAYVLCTMAAAFGGLLFALDANSVSPAVFGNFYELYAIAAAVLGGCTLRGGEGTILGVISGTAVMQMLRNLILLMGVPDTLEFAVIGGVILISVTIDEFVRRWVARRRAIAEAKNG